MTKEKYADIAESFYSKYAYFIEHTKFYNIFTSHIPNRCTINVEESGNEDNFMVLYLFVLGVSRCKIWSKSMVSLEIYFTI